MSSVATGSVHTVTTPAVGQFQANHQVQGSHYDLASSELGTWGIQWGIAAVDENEVTDGNDTGPASGNWTRNTGPVLTADENYQFRAYLFATDGTFYGSTIGNRTAAMAGSVATPGSSAITADSATINCDYTPRTLRSSASAQLQYKKTTDSTWIDAGSPGTTGGYSPVNVSRGISGLSPSTQYQVRMVLSRSTVNDTLVIGATHSFTTLAGEPQVTTAAATGVAATSANLNGTLVINAGTGVNVYFKWDTVSPPVAHQTADQSESADGSFQQAISGLTQNTLYYFQAFVSFSTPSGSPNEGAILSFTTPADPQAAAAEEAHVTMETFLGKFGVAQTITFSLVQPASSSSDLLFTGTAPLQADVQIYHDGVLQGATSDNAPAQVGSTQLYTLLLSIAEKSPGAGVIDVIIHDASGTIFRDKHIRVLTELAYSRHILDCATGSLTNASAFSATGFGSGSGIEAIGGATGKDISGVLGSHVIRNSLIATGGATPALDSGASAVNDFYNQMQIMMISGASAGQVRIINDYDGGTKVVTPQRAFSTNPALNDRFLILPGVDAWSSSPGAELSTVPTFNSSYGALLQFVFQRFAYKITQTATTQILFKANASSTLAVRTVGDDGSTQTVGMAT